MTKQNILDYVFTTLHNTNPMILEEMLDDLAEEAAKNIDSDKDMVERYTLKIITDFESNENNGIIYGTEIEYIKTNKPEILSMIKVGINDMGIDENSASEVFLGMLDSESAFLSYFGSCNAPTTVTILYDDFILFDYDNGGSEEVEFFVKNNNGDYVYDPSYNPSETPSEPIDIPNPSEEHEEPLGI